MNDQKLPVSGAIRIGELASRTGVNIETIRYYEREGVLPRPPRAENGYRVYPPELQGRLYFVKRSRELGFTLQQVRALLGLVDGGDYTCAEVFDLTREHLQEVRTKIRDLRTIEGVLEDMAARCDQEDVPDCPIIEALWPANVPT